MTAFLTKTLEGFERDIYPNSFISYSEDDQIRWGRLNGGRLPCDWIPRPKKKRAAQGGRKNNCTQILSPRKNNYKQSPEITRK